MPAKFDIEKHWNARYASEEAVYGREPNAYFSSWVEGQLSLGRPPSSMLLPADGEGRNGVFAAACGWDVTTFDASAEGVAKSRRWAEEGAPLAGRLNAEVGRAGNYSPGPDVKFDAIGLFYFHQQPDSRERFHKQVAQWLAPGGTLVLEGFGKGQLSFKSGGPSELSMLFNEAELREDFADLEVKVCSTEMVDLNEGPYHQGAAEVLRFIARRAG